MTMPIVLSGVRSTINPSTMWLRKIEKIGVGLQIVLRVRWNVHTVKVNDMDGESHQEYEYDEREIFHNLPRGIDTSVKLAQYIKDNKDNKDKFLTMPNDKTLERLPNPITEPDYWYGWRNIVEIREQVI